MLIRKSMLFPTFMFLALITTCVSADMLAQIRASRRSSGAADSVADSLIRLPSLPSRMQASDLYKTDGIPESDILLDKAINPDEYLVGPGDRFLVYMWGKLEERIELTVSSEAMLLLPSIGAVDVSGKTLAQTKTALREAILKAYRGVNIAISLVGIRRFRCYVLGEVQRPGAYVMTGVMRVSDAISMAGGISDSGAVRGIRIENERSGMRTADMARFFNSKTMESNPYLRDGDQVFVPPRCEYVSINGFVHYPGEYDFCDGDRISDLVGAAGGLKRGVDSSRIVITSFTDNSDALEHATLTLADAASRGLKPDDRVLVSGLEDYRVHRSVIIEGEVRFPGSYAISEGRSRVMDVINMAGGLTGMASLASSRIVRDTITFVNHAEYERLRSFAEGGQDPLETAYIKSRVRQDQGVVNIDFSALEKNSAGDNNAIVRSGDRIVITRKETTVRVSGAIASPGHVTFRDGAGLRYYVNEAGGFSGNAKRTWIRVRRQGSSVWQSPKTAGNIGPGDEILIGEKPYRESFFTVRDVIVILSSAATVILAVITINDSLK
jgi:protein involved in polysaccharide export with SLBB domain